MSYDWYKVINKDEFEASGLISKTVELVLEGIGQKKILVTRGNLTSIVYGDVMLGVELKGEPLFERDGYAVYLDEAGDIWLGIANES